MVSLNACATLLALICFVFLRDGFSESKIVKNNSKSSKELPWFKQLVGERIGDFIEPKKSTDSIDVFTIDKTDYLFVDLEVPYMYAENMCKSYGGMLATLIDSTTEIFLAEALSETNMILDSLWIGGRQIDNKWVWINGNKSSPISDSVIGVIVVPLDVPNYPRSCLAFQRKDHEKPQYRALKCDVDRPFICQKPRQHHDLSDNSTHPDWIQIEDGWYKIYRGEVDYDTAKERCIADPMGANLAVVSNLKVSRVLGRLLLIGRPSLENAWIGAKWSTIDNQYVFEPEPEIQINNVSDFMGFPPWRNKKITKTHGCILLDRHLAQEPIFVEARCHRLRGYICYRQKANSSEYGEYKDIKFKNRGYRIYYTAQPWDIAENICRMNKFILAEPNSSTKHNELLYVMGETTIDIQHIWIGGKMSEGASPQWYWNSNNQSVSVNLVPNQTYVEEVEAPNICLNMDRENHLDTLFYGARCSFPQNFVCEYVLNNTVYLK